MYSQNSEEQIIADYFGNFTGTLLDIGANDGRTFSNSLALIERGWSGVLVEPDIKAYNKLLELHKDNKKVCCYNIAIAGAEDFGERDFYKSGTHLGKDDTGLLSTLSSADYEKWMMTTTFEKIKIIVCSFRFFRNYEDEKEFDFITIDVEGMDLIILKQMNLTELGCKLLCIEYNTNAQTLKEMIEYAEKFRMKQIYINAENVIFALL